MKADHINIETEMLLQEKYNGKKTDAFLADCTRLNAGEPLAYVIGHIPFLSATIHLDSHSLIPRTETEFWTEKVINELRTNPAPLRILDLCAGSGCIGVAIQKEIRNATVDFAELDATHHPTIKKNMTTNTTRSPRIYDGDLFENITGTYDYIVSNPPYIDPALDRTEKSVKKYEPNIALYGGEDGMEIIKKIIVESPNHLIENGKLYIEHEPEQTKAINALGAENNFTICPHKDQYGTLRYTQLTYTKTLSVAQ